MTQAFIFDFDGTLVDSEHAIYQCFQSITKQLAPSRVEYAKNILIGPPLRDTASEILGPEHQDSLDKFVQLFIKMHDDQVIRNTHPYPDVLQVLKQLYNKKIPMAVATNKRTVPTKKLIEHLGWGSYFQFIECSDSQKNIRSKKEMIQDIINQNRSFHDGFFVGDTISDALSVSNHKIQFIRVNYGYGKKQNWSNIKFDYSIDNLNELVNLIF